jgi:polyisoprenoid-binding protein YceI
MAGVRHCQHACAIDRFLPACYPTRVIRLWRAGSLAFILVALATSASDSEPRRWVTVAGKSEVSFAATHPLGNFIGRTESVTGVFRADPENLRRAVSGSLQVNPAALKTGDDGRDRDMWKLLTVEKYAEIRFSVERVEPSFPSVAERSDVLVTITGQMLIRGVERPLAFSGRVRRRDSGLWVRGETEIKMSDFGISPPSRWFLQVGDVVLVGFDVQLQEEIRPGRLGLRPTLRNQVLK